MVGVRTELVHIRTNFGKNCRGGFFLDAGNGLQQGVLFAEPLGPEPRSDLAIKRVDFKIQKIEMAKRMPQKEAVVVGKDVPGGAVYPSTFEQNTQEYGRWNKNPNRLLDADKAALPQQEVRKNRRPHPVRPRQ